MTTPDVRDDGREDVRARSSIGDRFGLLTVWIAASILVMFLAIPVVMLAVRAVGDGASLDSASRSVMWDALRLSLTTSMIALALTVALGLPLAHVLARRTFRGAHVVNTLVDLPIVLPPAVAGIALLMAFGRQGFPGSWLDSIGITVGFTTTAVVMAQVFVSAPFFVRSAIAWLSEVSRDIENAARVDGASPWRVFRDITLPLAGPGIGAGMVLAWARALGEFGATIMFAGNFQGTTQTMPLAIYGRFSAGDLNTALMLSLLLLVTSAMVLFTTRVLIPRSARPWL